MLIPDTKHNLGWPGWGPRDAEPTTAIALWPDGEAPTRTEVLAALKASGFESEQDLDVSATSEDTLWTAVLQPVGDAPPMIVWAEPSQPMAPDELEDAAAENCKWIVGYQSLLDSDDPLPSLMRMLRCVDAGVPGAPAVLDVNSRRWLPREQLELLLEDDAPLPPSEVLWTIEAVSRDDGNGTRDQGNKGSSGAEAPGDGSVWLRTQGLMRCGRPELEMLEVPEDQVPVAATLLNDVAELLLEVEWPEPGDPIEVGVGLRIALQPWSEVGPFLRDGAAGTPDDRAARGSVESEDETPDRDVAIVCEAQPAGQFRKLWVWPSDVVRALAEEGAAVFKTTRATERTAALAQHTWPELAMLWVSARKAHEKEAGAPAEGAEATGPVILAKVGFEVVSDEDAPAREHLWFMIHEIAGNQARGQLINQPMHATTMEEGDTVWLNREGVSDWRLVMPGGIVQPADMLLRSPGLERLLARLEPSA